MTKAKISEYDAVAANNTDVNGVNIAENCPPSGMNNMGREIMAALKRFQTGSDGDGVTVGGNLVVSGTSTVAALNTSGQVVFNDAGADVDFRVEGDTEANLFFVDASADAVGIGTNTPTVKFHVKSAGAAIGLFESTLVAGNTNVETRYTSTNRSWGVGQNIIQTSSIFEIADVTAGATRLAIDSSGNVLVGLSTSVSGASGRGTVQINGSSSSLLGLAVNDSSAGYVFHDGTNIDIFNSLNGYLRFGTNQTERARITSDGFFKASNTGSYIGSTVKFHETVSDFADNGVLVVESTSASYASYVLTAVASRNTTNNTFYAIGYYNREVGAYRFQVADSGNVTNTNNSYGSISDVKLKQDIVDAGSQWDDIKSLRVRKYRWKSDPDGFMQMGLVAQEAEEVSPGLIDEHPDYQEIEVPVLDDEGNPVLNEDGTPQVTKERNALGTTTKAVKYSVLYMKAVKALQEAIERIETLEAKVAALEAK